MPTENLLDLFNTTAPPISIYAKLKSFISDRTAVLTKYGAKPLDIIVYYSGHGFFTGDACRVYCLALRGSEAPPLDELTSISVPALGRVLRVWAGWIRRYIILDACFSAAAMRDFQAPGSDVVGAKVIDALADRGTALLSASGPYEPTRAPAGEKYTQFSGALIAALRQGQACPAPRLSLRDIRNIVSAELQSCYKDVAARPEIHVPDQPDGDVACVPLFPNPAWVEDWITEAPRLLHDALECIRLGKLNEADIKLDRIEKAGGVIDERIRLQALFDRACVKSLTATSLVHDNYGRRDALDAAVDFLRRWLSLGLYGGVWDRAGNTPNNAIHTMFRDSDLHQVIVDRRAAVVELIPIGLREAIPAKPPKKYSGGGGCVPVGTPIETPTGLVPIEALREGDYILSIDPALPQRLLRTKVVHLRTLREPYCISINDDRRFTPTQPLLAPEGVIVRAADVHANDILLDRSGNPCRVDRVERVNGYFVVCIMTTDHVSHNYLANGFVCANADMK